MVRKRSFTFCPTEFGELCLFVPSFQPLEAGQKCALIGLVILMLIYVNVD